MLLVISLASALFADDAPRVEYRLASHHVFTIALLPFKNATAKANAPTAVAAAMESALAATGRFRVYHARVVVTRLETLQTTEYELQNAESKDVHKGFDIKLKPEVSKRKRVVRMPLVDFEVSGTIAQENERAHVVARLKYIPTGRVLATVSRHGEGDAPIMEAASKAAKALAAVAKGATTGQRADEILREYLSGVRTIANAETALLRMALANPNSFEPQVAVLALYQETDDADEQIVLLGRSLLPRLTELTPKQLLIFARLSIDPFAMVAAAQIRQKNYDGAVKTLKAALAEYPLNQPDNRVLMARAHTGAGRFDRAEKMLRGVLKKRPAHAAALFYAGRLEEARKKPAAAKKRYQELGRLAPDSKYAIKAAARLKALK